MKKTFALGALSGVTALVIGFPLVAQIAGAQSAPGASLSTVEDRQFARPPLTDEAIQDMIKGDQALLDSLDEITSTVRTATQAHKDALTAALTISDQESRGDAVRAAMDARRDALKAIIDAHPDLKGAMPFGGRGPGHGRGPDPEMLADKLGMSVDDLKSAIEAGQSIEQIAAEKGVELPARRMMGGHGRMGGRIADKLGMTADELTAALDSGKTIEQIAEEKGVTLPERPVFMGHFGNAFGAE